MGKRLYLFTSNFPFLKGEEFLENEVPVLVKHFDVYLIPLYAEGKQTRKTEKCKVVTDLSRELSHRTLSKLSRIPFVIDDLYSELIQFVRDPRILRCLFSFAIAANRIENWFMNSKLANPSDQNVFYSYWMNPAALAIGELRKKGFGNSVSICRAHSGDSYFDREDNRLKYLPLRKKILQNIDRVFFISEHGRKYLEEKFPFFKKIYDLSYLGVKERTRQKGKNDIPILISCSNIIPIKRVDLIIKSLALMKDHSFVWYHIGDGVGGSEIRKLAQNLLRKGTYSFLGRLTNEQVMEFYSNTLVDLFISTSLSEGLPVSMMEAMSFGIPVIGTNVGGVSEIVNSENGMLLSEKPNAQEVANAILEIIIRPEEKAEVLRRNAYDMWNKKFNAKNNYENFARKIGNLFDP